MGLQNEFQFELYENDEPSEMIKSSDPHLETNQLSNNYLNIAKTSKIENSVLAEAERKEIQRKLEIQNKYNNVNVTPAVLEMVSPAQASQMLTTSRINRVLRQYKVDDYVEIIKTGAWQCTHQGIAFDEDGHLFNGHHRLSAVVRSGMTVPIWVSRNCPKDSPIDTGIKRTSFDNITIGGLSVTIKTTYDTAVVTSMFTKKRLGSDPKIAEVSNYFVEEFDFLHLHFNKNLKRVRVAIVSSVILLAYYHLKTNPRTKDRLIDFCNILYSGIAVQKEDATVIKLRDYLLSNGAKGDRAKLTSVMHHHIKMYMDHIIAKKSKSMEEGFIYTYPIDAPYSGAADAK